MMEEIEKIVEKVEQFAEEIFKIYQQAFEELT